MLEILLVPGFNCRKFNVFLPLFLGLLEENYDVIKKFTSRLNPLKTEEARPFRMKQNWLCAVR
jgi:hypothetical protein